MTKAEEIAKKWDVYYLPSGEVNMDVLEAINEALRIHNVVGRSEQLTCPRCKSTNILSPDKDNDAQCIECAFIWAG